jgi:hypothetical protein
MEMMCSQAICVLKRDLKRKRDEVERKREGNSKMG